MVVIDQLHTEGMDAGRHVLPDYGGAGVNLIGALLRYRRLAGGGGNIHVHIVVDMPLAENGVATGRHQVEVSDIHGYGDIIRFKGCPILRCGDAE